MFSVLALLTAILVVAVFDHEYPRWRDRLVLFALVLPAIALSSALLSTRLARAKRRRALGQCLVGGAAVVVLGWLLAGVGLFLIGAAQGQPGQGLYVLLRMVFLPLAPFAWLFMTPALLLGSLGSWIYWRW